MMQTVSAEESTVKILSLAANADLSSDEVRRDARQTLERGGLVLLPESGFALTAEESRMISDTRAMLDGLGEEDIRNGRPTIIYEPSKGHIKRHHYATVNGKPVRARVKDEVLPDLEAMMARFGDWAEEIVRTLFPSYAAAMERDRITYRPHQRSDMQPLHVDSSYGYPTQGRAMFRVFCNIDPVNRPRVWQVGEPFEPFARRFIEDAQPRDPGWIASLLARLGIVKGAKTPYDAMMAAIRRAGKRDKDYQRTAPRTVIEFPRGAAWFGITDLVLHGAVSGQHSLDQTYFLPAAAMSEPARSSLRILERLSGRTLV